MKKTMPELCAEIAAAKTKQEKIDLLRKNDNPAFRSVLKAVFDPTFEWDLPEGTPPCKIDRDIPLGYADATMYSSARTLYLYEKKYTNIPKAKKEMLFIGLLESLHWTEADFLVIIKDGNFTKTFKGFTPGIVREAYPDLLPTPKSAGKVSQ